MNLEVEAKKKIEKFHKKCLSTDLITSAISKKDYNFEFLVNDSKNKIKVQVYFGKKGIKTVLQGDTNSTLYNQLNEIIFDQALLTFAQTQINEPEEYIGSDECGKGDFFGPLVTAAVHVDKTSQGKLKKIGVKDSKRLTETQISYLSKKITDITKDNFEIIKINPAKYNELYSKFNNLNKLLNWAHSKAIDSLLVKTKCRTVITDKFSNNDLTVSGNTNHLHVDFIQETGAEKYVGVAAASILARNEFNKWFNEQMNKGFDLPKGSSKIVEEKAAKLLSKINDDSIGNFAKLHFKTLKKLK